VNDPTDVLIYFAGSVKSLDSSGRVGGHLVLFGDEKRTDASSLKDFFTPETDFGLDLTTKSRILYHHGMDSELKSNRPDGCKLTVGEMKVDSAGVWIEGQLKLRDNYEKQLFEAIKNGKMGWSSGTASHLVRREAQANGSHKLLSWPLGLDASITPTPAETRTAAVSLKSLIAAASSSPRAGQTLDDHFETVRAAVKGMCDRLNDLATTRAEQGRLLSPKRRDEIKALGDRLNDLYAASEPQADSADIARLHSQFLAAEARFAGIL
jgi:hypothetical protein